MHVFFYGLFMDVDLLAKQGIRPASVHLGFVDGFALRIGARATLVRAAKGRAYGAIMDISMAQVEALYAEDSVADYVPEPVMAQQLDGTRLEAICYNLPAGKVAGMNADYAKALLALATRLDFPESYLDEIRQAGR